MAFRIRLEKENFKFSCSHFTIFGPAAAEALHGHNYYLSAEFHVTELDPRLGFAFDFNLVKPILRDLAARLDERVLIPTRSPYLKVKTTDASVEATYNDKAYVFPKADVVLIDIVNITSEELARYFADQLAKEFESSSHTEFNRISSMSIGIQETRGQTVFFDAEL